MNAAYGVNSGLRHAPWYVLLPAPSFLCTVVFRLSRGDSKISIVMKTTLS
ncbi:MAG: hypothetical protein GPOALKHO_000395 [Sodalis sp.]|nr:MAG: hypothetical protein GPOALKHO_000395 [Sodalis sp.]